MITPKCATCGGHLIRKRIAYDQHWGKDIVIFENVPADVCAECDTIWLEGHTVEEMDRILQTGTKPKKVREIPVWSLSV